MPHRAVCGFRTPRQFEEGRGHNRQTNISGGALPSTLHTHNHYWLPPPKDCNGQCEAAVLGTQAWPEGQYLTVPSAPRALSVRQCQRCWLPLCCALSLGTQRYSLHFMPKTQTQLYPHIFFSEVVPSARLLILRKVLEHFSMCPVL